MESIKKSIFFLTLVLSFSSVGKSKVVGRLYFQNFMGHLHKNPSKDSSSLTAIQCSHSVKVLSKRNLAEGWTYAKVGEDVGYIQTEFLGPKRPSCLQAKYPKFYLGMDLDITEMYFWGRLYDHYVQGRTKAQ